MTLIKFEIHKSKLKWNNKKTTKILSLPNNLLYILKNQYKKVKISTSNIMKHNKINK